MRMIHLKGYSDKERLLFKEFIIINIYVNMKKLIKAIDAQQLPINEELVVNFFIILYEKIKEMLEFLLNYFNNGLK